MTCLTVEIPTDIAKYSNARIKHVFLKNVKKKPFLTSEKVLAQDVHILNITILLTWTKSWDTMDSSKNIPQLGRISFTKHGTTEWLVLAMYGNVHQTRIIDVREMKDPSLLCGHID